MLPVKDATSGTVITAVAKAFARLPETMRKTLTWDRGTEMTRHAEFTWASGVPVYFCDAYCPWQRGSNENTVSVVPACCSQVRRGWCRQREVALENTGRRSRRAFRWTCPSGCRHRPGPLVMA